MFIASDRTVCPRNSAASSSSAGVSDAPTARASGSSVPCDEVALGGASHREAAPPTFPASDARGSSDAASSKVALNPRPGAPGIGDPYFPLLGNGGYDAQHYTIDASVDVDANRLAATTTMNARATQDLSSFNLDFRGFDISRITVDGAPATFARKDG